MRRSRAAVCCLALTLTTLAVSARGEADWDQAIVFDRVETIVRYLDDGQDANAAAASGKTALMAAAKVGDHGLTERLLAAGADANAANHKGGSVLMYAVLSGDSTMIERVLDAGAGVRAVTTTGWSALMIASAKNYAALVELLLAHGADANQQDIYGWTPLIRAAHEGYLETAQQLLEQPRIDLTLADENGRNALHHAALSGDEAIVSTLLAHGASSASADAQGRLPRQLAHEAGHRRVARLLAGAARN